MKKALPLLLAVTLFSVACTHSPVAEDTAAVVTVPEPEVEVASVEEPVVEPTKRERGQRVIELLNQGKEAPALVELDAMLEADPEDSFALKLREQVTADPVELLGETYTMHSVQPGETTSALAKTFLGDSLMFYALSRYNQLEAPNRLMAGQDMKIPGEDVPAGDVEEAVAEPVDVVPLQIAEAPADREKKTSIADAAAANALRLKALQLLNSGDSSGALALLQRASVLDENNEYIAADMAKAERIHAALGGLQ
ncbi:LysM domain-containing protein [Henriciella sp. AS95]|uniref:LysM domain-containing protein n=1 Tax=Henriciella sp. AS95 TaxID=3135782 RepID=UPI00317E054A